MAARDDQKERVQQASDIVRLIGEQVALKPRGREFIGLCPFHDDSNPSMYVSPAKQIYKCFSCGAGGDVFSFAMNYHKMTFPEALRFLAERAGIRLEQHQQQAEEGPSERDRIRQANTWALDFFRRQLHDTPAGQTARDYIDQRGIHPDMVQAFQLGYAPDGWDGLVQAAGKLGGSLKGLELAGLVSPRKNASGHYDRFRHRLIFPIFDAIGRPLAFGGRKLRDEDEPKYLNSPETRLFNKSATLYGLHLAKKPIIDSRRAVIVEGYTDVIACHQAGASNVVATLGTALTAEHVTELRRYADSVVLIFDADAAGQKAADRAVELFLNGELDVQIAVLPGGQDPADLLAREDGLAQWHAAIEQAEDALGYQFNRVQEQLGAADTVTAQQRLAEQYLAQLARLGFDRMGSVRRGLTLRRLAGLLSLNEATVSEILKRAAPRRGPAAPPREAGETDADRGGPGSASERFPEDNSGVDFASPEPAHRLKAVGLAERQLIGCLIRRNELFQYTLPDGLTVDEAIAPGDLVTDAHRRLYQLVHDRLAENQSLTLPALLGELAAQNAPELAALATETDAEVDRAVGDDEERVTEVMAAAVEALRRLHAEREYQRTRAELSAGGGGDSRSDQIRLLNELIEHRRANPSPARIARLRE